jgi:hypothetical protein
LKDKQEKKKEKTKTHNAYIHAAEGERREERGETREERDCSFFTIK